MKRLAVCSLLVLACCAGGGPPLSSDLDRPVNLRYRQTALVREEGLRLTFREVIKDTRCPIGITCPAVGEATIRVVAWKFGSPAASIELTWPYPNTARYLDYGITFVSLRPGQRLNHPTPPFAYVATLTVTKE